MRVLVGCEFSGRVRDAFLRLGHEAVSCDFMPTESNALGMHYQGDIRELLYKGYWDLGIFFPPCTYLARSGIHWNNKVPGRSAKTEEAVVFVSELLNAPIPKICVENPIGVLSTRIRKPDQIIQPWQFGHPEAKGTCLWLKNLPLLKPTKVLSLPESGRWENQTPTGQNKLSSSRAKERSLTYLGIAEAMAQQWGANGAN